MPMCTSMIKYVVYSSGSDTNTPSVSRNQNAPRNTPFSARDPWQKPYRFLIACPHKVFFRQRKHAMHMLSPNVILKHKVKEKLNCGFFSLSSLASKSLYCSTRFHWFNKAELQTAQGYFSLIRRTRPWWPEANHRSFLPHNSTWLAFAWLFWESPSGNQRKEEKFKK